MNLEYFIEIIKNDLLHKPLKEELLNKTNKQFLMAMTRSTLSFNDILIISNLLGELSKKSLVSEVKSKELRTITETMKVLDEIVFETDKIGKAEHIVILADRNLSLDIDNMLASQDDYDEHQKTTGWKLSLDDGNYQRFKRGSYYFYKKDSYYLNNPSNILLNNCSGFAVVLTDVDEFKSKNDEQLYIESIYNIFKN